MSSGGDDDGSRSCPSQTAARIIQADEQLHLTREEFQDALREDLVRSMTWGFRIAIEAIENTRRDGSEEMRDFAKEMSRKWSKFLVKDTVECEARLEEYDTDFMRGAFVSLFHDIGWSLYWDHKLDGRMVGNRPYS